MTLAFRAFAYDEGLAIYGDHPARPTPARRQWKFAGLPRFKSNDSLLGHLHAIWKLWLPRQCWQDYLSWSPDDGLIGQRGKCRRNGDGVPRSWTRLAYCRRTIAATGPASLHHCKQQGVALSAQGGLLSAGVAGAPRWCVASGCRCFGASWRRPISHIPIAGMLRGTVYYCEEGGEGGSIESFSRALTARYSWWIAGLCNSGPQAFENASG